DVDHAVPGQHTLLADGAHALLHRGHEHAVDVIADERLRELQSGVPLCRLDPQPHLGELSGTAGLLLVAVTRFGSASNGFAIGNPRRFEFHRHSETSQESLDDDLKMNLALP